MRRNREGGLMQPQKRIDLVRISRLVRNVDSGKLDYPQVVLFLLTVFTASLLIGGLACALAAAF